jgi:hypothetical protein
MAAKDKKMPFTLKNCPPQLSGMRTLEIPQMYHKSCAVCLIVDYFSLYQFSHFKA